MNNFLLRVTPYVAPYLTQNTHPNSRTEDLAQKIGKFGVALFYAYYITAPTFSILLTSLAAGRIGYRLLDSHTDKLILKLVAGIISAYSITTSSFAPRLLAGAVGHKLLGPLTGNIKDTYI